MFWINKPISKSASKNSRTYDLRIDLFFLRKYTGIWQARALPIKLRFVYYYPYLYCIIYRVDPLLRIVINLLRIAIPTHRESWHLWRVCEHYIILFSSLFEYYDYLIKLLSVVSNINSHIIIPKLRFYMQWHNKLAISLKKVNFSQQTSFFLFCLNIANLP